MRILLTKGLLRLKLIWNHAVFWTVGTVPENYYSDIGKIYFDDLNYIRAISYFLKSEQSHGSRDIPLTRYNSYYLGHSYLALGALRHAIQHLEKYFQLSKSDSEAASLIGWYYELLSDHETALSWYLRALAVQPNLWECRVECARLLAELGRREEALEQLEESKAVAQTSLKARVIDSLKQRLCEDQRGAIQTLHEAVSAAESLDQPSELAQIEGAYLLMAKFQRELGDLNGARASLETALERNSSDPWICNEIAMEYADQEIRLAEALALIDRALQHQEYNPIFLDTKGWVLFKLGRREEAKAIFEKCLKLLPGYKVAEKHYQMLTTCL